MPPDLQLLPRRATALPDMEPTVGTVPQRVLLEHGEATAFTMNNSNRPWKASCRTKAGHVTFSWCRLDVVPTMKCCNDGSYFPRAMCWPNVSRKRKVLPPRRANYSSTARLNLALDPGKPCAKSSFSLPPVEEFHEFYGSVVDGHEHWISTLRPRHSCLPEGTSLMSNILQSSPRHQPLSVEALGSYLGRRFPQPLRRVLLLLSLTVPESEQCGSSEAIRSLLVSTRNTPAPSKPR